MFVSLHFRADLFNLANWSQEWYPERSEEAQASKLIYAYGSCMLMITFAFPCYHKRYLRDPQAISFSHIPPLIQTLVWSICAKRTSLADMKDEALLGASEHAEWRLDTVFLVEKRWYERNRYLLPISVDCSKEKPVIRNDFNKNNFLVKHCISLRTEGLNLVVV